MPQSLTSLTFHIIFSTRDRRPFITPVIQQRIYDYIGGILAENNSRLLAAGGIADHIHLLVSLSKQLAVSDALRLIKANSSKWIHETFPKLRAFGWQTGYGAFTVSFSNISRVKTYIANQAEHHRTRDFQQEFRTFLKRHGLEYDERYVWD